MRRGSFALLLGAVAVVPGCGADDGAIASDLSPAALEGRSVAQSKGCAACHGANGAGSVGPPFVGLFGSEVSLQSGETVIADRDYLERSILEPSAQLVEGYNLPMPRTELTSAEIDAVIAYIEELSESAP